MGLSGLEQIMILPIYIFIALIIWRVLRLDAWLRPLIDEYRSPGSLENRINEIEQRLERLEKQ